MNKDVVFAASVAIALHGALAWFGHHPHTAPAVLSNPDQPIVTICQFDPIAPVDPDPLDSDSGPKAQAPEFAPPSLPEPPAPAVDVSFPSPLQPTLEIPQSDTPVLPQVRPAGDGGNGSGIEYIPYDQLSKPPVPIYQAPPVYPSEMKRTGRTAIVQIEFLVDAQGNVRNPHGQGTEPEFDQAAEAALRRWRFHPGMKDGRPVTTRMQIPIVFTLAAD